MNSVTLVRPTRIAIIFLFVIAAACSTEEDTNNDVSAVNNFSFGQTIVIGTNGQAHFSAFGGVASIDIQVTSIADSRCPTGGVCIWAGRVDVTFKIDGTDQSVTLCPWDTSYCNNPYEFTVGKVHYRLTLKDVTPYPSTTNGSEEKQVKFVVDVI